MNVVGVIFLALMCAAMVAVSTGFDYKQEDNKSLRNGHIFRALRAGNQLRGNPWEGSDLCATRKPTKEDNEKAMFAMNKWNMGKQKGKKTGHGRDLGSDNIVVPTRVHIIYEGSEELNEAHGNVDKQIDTLNEAFGSTSFYFRLDGTSSTEQSQWWNNLRYGTGQERKMKRTLRIGGKGTLNIYYSKLPQGLLGWATFPWWYDSNQDRDGVVVLHSAIDGGTSNPYDKGKTLVHEVGHWLGLYHTFQGGCNDPGDHVDDTNKEEIPAYGCPIERNTCGSLDPVQNYMDYSEDMCTDHFTSNQAERMLAQWCEYRTDSPPSPPCTLTPTPEPCMPRGYDLGSCPSGLDSICCSGKCFLNTGKCKP